MAFQFKLNRRHARQRATQYINGSLKVRKKQEDVINKWISGESNFNKQMYIELWEKYRKEYGDKILHDVLKTMAVANSIVDVNHILQFNMGMGGASLETNLLNPILDKTMHVSLANMFIQDTSWPEAVKIEALTRIMARQFVYPHERNKPGQQGQSITIPVENKITKTITRGE